MAGGNSVTSRALAMVLAAGVSSPTMAHAGVHGFDAPVTRADEAEARQLLDQGVDALHGGKLEVAVQKLEEAYALGKDPVALYHLGRAHAQRFGQDGDALHLRKATVVLRSYMETAGADAPLAAAVRAELARIEAELDELEAAASSPRLSLAPLPRLDPGRDRRPGALGLVGSILMGSGLVAALTGSITGFTTAKQMERDGGDPARQQRARNAGYLSLGLGGAAIITGMVLVVLQAARNRKPDRDGRSARIRFGATGVEMSF